MTVKELIERLQKMPEAQELKVGYWRYSPFGGAAGNWRFNEYHDIQIDVGNNNMGPTVGLYLGGEEE